MYRHLNITGNLVDLIDLNQFKLTADPKIGVTIFEFYISDRWVPLTKQRFGGVNTMSKHNEKIFRC